MQCSASWKSVDGLLVLSTSVCEVFRKYRQQAGGLEAGGILLGLRRGPHIEVIQATPPSEFDRRSRSSFFRHARVHEGLAHHAWWTSGGRTDYVGEWHTHAEPVPSPSSLDVTEWTRVAREARSDATMLGIIVGTEGLYVERYEPNGRRVVYYES
jgi:integrative and conjugative element protein (TIGR02256 family)